MIGVVADDLTGANDIGIMFAKNGYLTHVYSTLEDTADLDNQVDVLILNTNSRLDSPDIAYEKVKRATEKLQELGCSHFYNKTCSVFRGNIGAELDAMLDTLGLSFCPVILGFPKNGRVTREGLHYVYGDLLENSAFRNDPTHPMTESDLVKILEKQTKRQVGLLSHEIVEQGVETIASSLEDLKEKYEYVILDVGSQEDLHNIAGGVKDERVIAGSSAIAEELPKWLGPSSHDQETSLDSIGNKDIGTLVLAGSVTPQTREQVQFAKDSGYLAYTLEVEPLLERESRDRSIRDLVEKVVNNLSAGKDVLVHSQNKPEEVVRAKEAGARKGLSDREVGRLVSSTLASFAKEVVERLDLSRLVILGGETSGAITNALGIVGNVVLEEIDPGVPSGLALGETSLLLVLKSGSFGADDFVIKATNHLKALQKDS